MNGSTWRKPAPAERALLALAVRSAAVIAGLLAAASCHLFEPPKAPRNPHPQVAVYECHGEDCRPLDLDMESVFAESDGMGQIMPVAYSCDEGGGPGFAQVTVASAGSGCGRVVIWLPSSMEFRCWPKRQTLQVCTTLPAGKYKIRYLPERGTFEVVPGKSGKAWSQSQTLLEVFIDGRSSTKKPFFSKGMAVLTTLGVMTMCGATAGEIVTLARAWIQLRDDTAQAKKLAEIEAAAAKFGRALGGSGARLLVAVATIVAGKALGGRRATSPSTTPPALPALATPQGSPAVALQVRVVGSVPELVAVPLAMAAASGKGSSGGGHGARPGGPTGFKPFTADNFRENLARLTGGIPKGAQAHHVFPQKYAKKFADAGINIHDPRYGAWWQSPAHQRRAALYNERWREFLFTAKPKTREEIFRFGRDLAREYGFQIFF